MSQPDITSVSFSIKRTKLTDYLLNADHRVGGSKARFFLGHGFERDDSDALAAALLDHTRFVSREVPHPFGRRLICEGPLRTPNGTAPNVRTVWQLRAGDSVADLVTAYQCD